MSDLLRFEVNDSVYYVTVNQGPCVEVQSYQTKREAIAFIMEVCKRELDHQGFIGIVQ